MNRIRTGVLAVVCLTYLNVSAQTATRQMSLEDVRALGLPVVEVLTVGGEEPAARPVDHPEGGSGFSITDVTKVPGSLTIWAPDGQPLYSSGDYAEGESGMTIKIRGNNSARRKLKPYKVKLQQKADLLSRGEPTKYADKNWLLLKEMGHSLNIPIGLKMNELMGFSWTPCCLHVNLIFNGEYRGVYLLTEQVCRNPRCRINVDKETGYIIERDIYWWVAEVSFASKRFAGPWQRYTFKYPDEDDVTEAQIEYIRSAVDEMEDAVWQGEGYERYLDMHSFAAWTLGHDILGTSDAGGANRFLIKYDNTPESKFFMGTLWDFDTLFMTEGEWSSLHVYDGHYSKVLFRATDTSFTEEYVRLWKECSSMIVPRMSHFLDSLSESAIAAAIDTSRQVESRLWKREFRSVNDNIAEAHEWFVRRVTWMNQKIDSIALRLSVDAVPMASKDILFDLSGRRLSAPPARGIYIKNGQKRVARGKE